MAGVIFFLPVHVGPAVIRGALAIPKPSAGSGGALRLRLPPGIEPRLFLGFRAAGMKKADAGLSGGGGCDLLCGYGKRNF